MFLKQRNKYEIKTVRKGCFFISNENSRNFSSIFECLVIFIVKLDKGEFMKKSTKEILNYIFAILGASLVGLGEAWLLIPLKLTTGGFNGISMLVYYLFEMPVGLVSILLNLPLFFVSLKMLGIKYSFKTLIAMLITSLTIEVASKLVPF